MSTTYIEDLPPSRKRTTFYVSEELMQKISKVKAKLKKQKMQSVNLSRIVEDALTNEINKIEKQL